MKRKNYVFILIIISLGLGLGLNTERLRPYFLDNIFFNFIYLLLGLSVLIILIKNLLPNLYQRTVLEQGIKIVYFIFFFPLVIFPIFRCYFRVPYLFCHLCPSRCAWGWLRLYIIPTALLLNIDKRYWCFKLCPLGTVQDIQNRAVKKKIKFNKNWFYIGYLPLILTVIFYVLIFPEYSVSFYNYMLKGIYAFSLGVFITVLAAFILAFLIPRFFCNIFCPVGCFSRFLLKVYGNKKS